MIGAAATILAAVIGVIGGVVGGNENDNALPQSQDRNTIEENSPPVRVTVARPIRVDPRWDEFPIFLIPRPIHEIPPPPSADRGPSKRYDWARPLGGVDGGTTQVGIAVEGRSSSPIVLLGLEINVLKRRSPMTGSAVSRGGVGDYLQIRHIAVDLDRRPPSLLLEDSRHEAQSSTWSFPLQLNMDAVEYIEIDASTDDYDVTWTATLRYIGNGKAKSLELDDNGRPFRTSATKRAIEYASNDGKTFQRLGP